MKLHKILLTLLVSAVVYNVSAGEIPTGYYDSANGKSDNELKGALKNIIRKHTVLSYGDGDNSSWYCFYYSDRDTATNLCMDMYCDDWKPFTSPGVKVSGCNIEHSFAKSWWGGAENDAYKDCFHLNPSNSTANSARSNFPLGNVTTATKTAGSLKIGEQYHAATGETHSIWEPKDEYKGDFARAYFYMATCYGRYADGTLDNVCSAYKGWRLDNGDVGSRYAMQNDNYLEFQDWEIEVLIQWHRQDPVSIKEINRASAVNDFQKNRNPFIDYPCLAEYIWGNKKGEEVDFSKLKCTRDADYLELSDEDKCGCNFEITDPTITSPKRNSSLDFGTVGVGENSQKTITIEGVLLTQDLTLTLSGDDAAKFTISTTKVTAAQALAGYEVTLTYTPTIMNNDVATLTISSAELTKATTVNLTGKCGFASKPATNITESGFTANWTNAGLDSYTITVYTEESSGISEETILEDPCDNTSKASSTAGYVNYENSALRLGSGSKTGSLSYTGLDLSKGGKVVVNAKSYSGDEGVNLIITAGTTTETFTITSDYADYTLEFEANEANTNATVTIETKSSGKRAYVADVQVIAGGEKIEQKIVDGYPKNVSGTSHYVSITMSDQPVYYYVVGNSVNGGTIEVKLGGSTPVQNPEQNADQIVCITSEEYLQMENLPNNCDIHIYDISGRKIAQRNNCFTSEQFTLEHGIYIVLVNNQGQLTPIKVVK